MKLFTLSVIALLFSSQAFADLGERKTSKTQDKTVIPEHLTIDYWKSVTPEQLQKKLKDIKNVNEARPDTGETMLVLSVREGQYPEMVDMLVNAGADCGLKTKRTGEPAKGAPLHWAVIRSDKAYEFTESILKCEKNIDHPDEPNRASPMQWALYFRQSVKLISFLLSRGADPHFQCKRQYTTLTAAVIPNPYAKINNVDSDTVKLLMSHGVDLRVKNNLGKTAYDYMKENEKFAKTALFKKISTKFRLTSSDKADRRVSSKVKKLLNSIF